MSSVFKFGKHKGKNFNEVSEADPGYCQWVLGLDSPSGALAEFAAFLRQSGATGTPPGRALPAGARGGAAPAPGGRAGDGDVVFVCEMMRDQQFCVRAERTAAGQHGKRDVYMPPQTWNAVAQMRGARMSPDRRKWVFELREHDSVVAGLKQLGTVEPIPSWVFEILRRAEKKAEVVLNPDILPPALLPYQQDGVRFGMSRSGCCLIGDEMGLGKTLQALSIAAQYMQEWPVLVVCPSSVRGVWKEQIVQWLPDLVEPSEVQVIQSGAKNFDTDAAFWIISYNLLATDAKKGKFQQRPDGSPHGFVIADESHNIKEWSAARTKALVPIMRSATRKILLSGTPTRNSPDELHPQLCGLLPWAPKLADFRARYCAQQEQRIPNGRLLNRVVGARNTAELNHLLEATVMVRRLKKDVLAQLPEKRRQRIPLEVANAKALKDARNAYREYQRGSGASGMFVDGGADDTSTMFKSLAQAKLPAVKEYILEVLERGDEKAIIFGHHQVLLDAVEEVLRAQLSKDGLCHVRIDGKTPSAKRPALVRQFQEEPDCRVALLSITACGEGITLTAAGLVIFAELYWVPGAVEQAEARAHRIGTTHSKVVVEFLVVPNSPDDDIFKSLERKKQDTSSVLDGAAETLAAQCAPARPRKRSAPAEEAAEGDECSQSAKRLFAALGAKANQQRPRGRPARAAAGSGAGAEVQSQASGGDTPAAAGAPGMEAAAPPPAATERSGSAAAAEERATTAAPAADERSGAAAAEERTEAAPAAEERTEAAPAADDRSRAASAAAAAAPATDGRTGAAPAAAEEKVSIEVRATAEGETSRITYSLRCTSSLDRLMRAWCRHQGMQLPDVRFLHDGRELRPDATPGGLGAEPGGRLVLHAVPRPAAGRQPAPPEVAPAQGVSTPSPGAKRPAAAAAGAGSGRGGPADAEAGTPSKGAKRLLAALTSRRTGAGLVPAAAGDGDGAPEADRGKVDFLLRAAVR